MLRNVSNSSSSSSTKAINNKKTQFQNQDETKSVMSPEPPSPNNNNLSEEIMNNANNQKSNHNSGSFVVNWFKKIAHQHHSNNNNKSGLPTKSPKTPRKSNNVKISSSSENQKSNNNNNGGSKLNSGSSTGSTLVTTESKKEKKARLDFELNRLNGKIENLVAKIDETKPEIAISDEEKCMMCQVFRSTMQTFPCKHQVSCRPCFIKSIQLAVETKKLPLRCMMCNTKILRLQQNEVDVVQTSKTSSSCNNNPKNPQRNQLQQQLQASASSSSMIQSVKMINQNKNCVESKQRPYIKSSASNTSFASGISSVSSCSSVNSSRSVDVFLEATSSNNNDGNLMGLSAEEEENLDFEQKLRLTRTTTIHHFPGGRRCRSPSPSAGKCNQIYPVEKSNVQDFPIKSKTPDAKRRQRSRSVNDCRRNSIQNSFADPQQTPKRNEEICTDKNCPASPLVGIPVVQTNIIPNHEYRKVKIYTRARRRSKKLLAHRMTRCLSLGTPLSPIRESRREAYGSKTDLVCSPEHSYSTSSPNLNQRERPKQDNSSSFRKLRQKQIDFNSNEEEILMMIADEDDKNIPKVRKSVQNPQQSQLQPKMIFVDNNKNHFQSSRIRCTDKLLHQLASTQPDTGSSNSQPPGKAVLDKNNNNPPNGTISHFKKIRRSPSWLDEDFLLIDDDDEEDDEAKTLSSNCRINPLFENDNFSGESSSKPRKSRPWPGTPSCNRRTVTVNRTKSVSFKGEEVCS